MSEVVKVSTVESGQELMAAIEGYFTKERYAEITQAIGMHSILIDPNHSIENQKRLYYSILEMIKNRIAGRLGKEYSTWYTRFSAVMDGIVTRKQVVTDEASAEVLASRRAAFGPFRSVEDFFFWALDDRRLTLDGIVNYLEKSSESNGK
jgi:hypothetical protein